MRYRDVLVLAVAIALVIALGLVIGRSVVPGAEQARAARAAARAAPVVPVAPDTPGPAEPAGEERDPVDPPPVVPAAPPRDPTADALEEQSLRDAVAGADAGPERLAARRRLATLLHDRGRFVDAADEWRTVRKVTGATEDHRGEAASLLAFAERVLGSGAPGAGVRAAFEDARLALLRAKAAGDDTAATALGLARCFEAQENPASAVTSLTDAATRWPDDVPVRRALSFALLNAGRNADALPLFRTLSDAAPDDVTLARALSYCARETGDIEGAGTAAERAVRAAPQDAAAWQSLWEAFARSGRFGELADRLARLANELPDVASGPHYAGFAYARAARTDEALAQLEEAWQRRPDNVAARIEAARLRRDAKKDLAGAAALYRDVLALWPGHAGAVDGLGYIAVTLGGERKHAEALPFFEEVARARPESGTARADLALALRWLGRYDEAVTTYEQAVLASPGDAQIRNDMGLLLLVMGRDEDAAAAFRGGHEVDPLHNDGPENLGFMARERGDLAAARRWFDAALQAAVRRGDSDLQGRHRRTTDDVRFPLPPLFE